MAILSWRTSDGQTGHWQLNQAAARIGRAEGNDFTIPDGSVSSVHAELVLNGGTLVIRDLGSTNGTFVFDQRVQQAIVEPGQAFRLGNVEFSYQDDASLIQEALPAPAAPTRIHLAPHAETDTTVLPLPVPDAATGIGSTVSVPSGPVCFQHPVSNAVYTCTKCGHHLCAACAKQELIGGKSFPFCRQCGGKCVAYGQSAIPQRQARPTFGAMLPTVFTYPFKGNGLILLATGTVFFGFLDLLTSSPIGMARGSGWIVKVIMYGYLFAFMQKIVCASADGEDEPPSWPEVTDMSEDIFHPFWLFLATTVASFAPGIILTISTPLSGLLLMLLGAFYFPMALLAVGMADSVSGLNPLVVFSAILKVPRQYIISVIVCGFLVLVRGWLPDVFRQMGIPIVPTFVLAGVALFLVMVEMRILGVLYYTNKEKFGWF